MNREEKIRKWDHKYAVKGRWCVSARCIYVYGHHFFNNYVHLFFKDMDSHSAELLNIWAKKPKVKMQASFTKND